MMITRAGLTYYRFVCLPVALGLILPSLFIPWVTINFLGSSLFSPLDIIRVFFLQGAGDTDQNRFNLYDLMSSYNDTFSASVASIGFLVASIAIMSTRIILRAHRSSLVLIAGCLAVASCVFWLYSIESLKINFSQQAAITGGIVGEEFRGHERALADIIIRVGLGPYLALGAGVAGIIYNIAGTTSAKR